MGFVKTININFTDNLPIFPITKSLWSYLKLLLICLLELGFGFDQSLPRGQPVGKSLYYRSFDRSANWRVKDSIDTYLTFGVISVRYKRKERHWWRHNGDSYPSRRRLSSLLQCDRVTLCSCDDLGQINEIFNWEFNTAETCQSEKNIVWAWDKFVTPCLLPRIREFIHA